MEKKKSKKAVQAETANYAAQVTGALNYAIQMIESYEQEIKEAILDGLVKPGFCQGAVYKKAIKDIKKMAGRDKI